MISGLSVILRISRIAELFIFQALSEKIQFKITIPPYLVKRFSSSTAPMH
jgi:hypothetical protein